MSNSYLIKGRVFQACLCGCGNGKSELVTITIYAENDEDALKRFRNDDFFIDGRAPTSLAIYRLLETK